MRSGSISLIPIPSVEQSNFTREGFYSTVQREPAGAWQGWLRKLGQKAKRDCGNRVPAFTGLEEEQRQLQERLRTLLAEAEAAYSAETFSPQLAARTCCELVRQAQRFGSSEDHWRTIPGREQRRAGSIGLELLAAKVLAVIASPIVPGFSNRLWKSLGYTSPISGARWESILEPVPPGAELSGLDVFSFEAVKEQAPEQYLTTSSKT